MEYNWVQDFISTTPILEPVREGTDEIDGTRYQFVNPVFYDFFLAESILNRFAVGLPPGISDEQGLKENTVSSLVLYFLKQRITKSILDRISALATQETISNIDRLFMIYLLEDHPSVVRVLHAAPTGYRTFLYELQSTLTTVLARVVRYQVVLLDGNERRAFEFLDWVHTEQTEHREPEGQLPAFIEPHEKFLLTRLSNKVLAPALPITVFRLGQLGEAEARIALQQLLNDSSISDGLRKVTNEAIAAIDQRLGDDVQ